MQFLTAGALAYSISARKLIQKLVEAKAKILSINMCGPGDEGGSVGWCRVFAIRRMAAHVKLIGRDSHPSEGECKMFICGD